MLANLKYTSARLNTDPPPCIGPQSTNKPARKVTFTKQGLFTPTMILTAAMSAAKKREKRQKNAPRTPKRPKLPVRPLIGSSSTWNKEELDRFKVECLSEVDSKLLIPSTFFEVNNLPLYQTCNLPFDCANSSPQPACFHQAF